MQKYTESVSSTRRIMAKSKMKVVESTNSLRGGSTCDHAHVDSVKSLSCDVKKKNLRTPVLIQTDSDINTAKPKHRHTLPIKNDKSNQVHNNNINIMDELASSKYIKSDFPRQLMDMLSDADNSDTIKWSGKGDKFQIINKVKFETKTLPKYFKHKHRVKIDSFQRKLKRWGFVRFKHGVFSHKFFQKGRQDLLDNMTHDENATTFPRKKTSSMAPSTQVFATGTAQVGGYVVSNQSSQGRVAAGAARQIYSSIFGQIGATVDNPYQQYPNSAASYPAILSAACNSIAGTLPQLVLLNPGAAVSRPVPGLDGCSNTQLKDYILIQQERLALQQKVMASQEQQLSVLGLRPSGCVAPDIPPSSDNRSTSTKQEVKVRPERSDISNSSIIKRRSGGTAGSKRKRPEDTQKARKDPSSKTTKTNMTDLRNVASIMTSLSSRPVHARSVSVSSSASGSSLGDEAHHSSSKNTPSEQIIQSQQERGENNNVSSITGRSPVIQDRIIIMAKRKLVDKAISSLGRSSSCSCESNIIDESSDAVTSPTNIGSGYNSSISNSMHSEEDYLQERRTQQ